MADILVVKSKLTGKIAQSREEWMSIFLEDPSEEQLQKWIFAWWFLPDNCGQNNMMCMDTPQARFEVKFLAKYNVSYDCDSLKKLKKN
jgi:hypothetical protein